MSERDRYELYPPDEPVIGATYPPSIATQEPAFPESTRVGYYEREVDDEWDADYEEEPQYDEYGRPYYEEGYYEEAPVRQPMFYVFIGLAVVLGVVFIALLFALFRNNGNETNGNGTPISQATQFRILIDQPLANDALETGRDHDVFVSATSTEKITKFELFIDNKFANATTVNTAPVDQIYKATLKAHFEKKGEYSLHVRVHSESGATKDSEAVRINAIERVDNQPPTIKGRALTQASLKAAPSDDAETVGTLAAGQEVTITGRSKDNGWLQLNIDGGRWVRRTAIEPEGSLGIVPIRDATPSPSPSASASPTSGTPTATTTATPAANAVDLVPNTALLLDGGTTLRVTVANISTNRYEGALEVAVANVAPGTLTQAFSVVIAANGSVTVDFELNPPVTSEKSAQIRVDPGNAIRETSEDNNQVTVRLTPPVEQPELVIADVSPQGGTVNVTVRNDGGPLASSTVTVRIIVGQNAAEQSKTLALTRENPPVQYSGIARPGTGEGRVEVLINGQVVASATFTFP